MTRENIIDKVLTSLENNSFLQENLGNSNALLPIIKKFGESKKSLILGNEFILSFILALVSLKSLFWIITHPLQFIRDIRSLREVYKGVNEFVKEAEQKGGMNLFIVRNEVLGSKVLQSTMVDKEAGALPGSNKVGLAIYKKVIASLPVDLRTKLNPLEEKSYGGLLEGIGVLYRVLKISGLREELRKKGQDPKQAELLKEELRDLELETNFENNIKGLGSALYPFIYQGLYILNSNKTLNISESFWDEAIEIANVMAKKFLISIKKDDINQGEIGILLNIIADKQFQEQLISFLGKTDQWKSLINLGFVQILPSVNQNALGGLLNLLEEPINFSQLKAVLQDNKENLSALINVLGVFKSSQEANQKSVEGGAETKEGAGQQIIEAVIRAFDRIVLPKGKDVDISAELKSIINIIKNNNIVERIAKKGSFIEILIDVIQDKNLESIVKGNIKEGKSLGLIIQEIGYEVFQKVTALLPQERVSQYTDTRSDYNKLLGYLNNLYEFVKSSTSQEALEKRGIDKKAAIKELGPKFISSIYDKQTGAMEEETKRILEMAQVLHPVIFTGLNIITKKENGLSFDLFCNILEILDSGMMALAQPVQFSQSPLSQDLNPKIFEKTKGGLLRLLIGNELFKSKCLEMLNKENTIDEIMGVIKTIDPKIEEKNLRELFILAKKLLSFESNNSQESSILLNFTEIKRVFNLNKGNLLILLDKSPLAEEKGKIVDLLMQILNKMPDSFKTDQVIEVGIEVLNDNTIYTQIQTLNFFQIFRNTYGTSFVSEFTEQDFNQAFINIISIIRNSVDQTQKPINVTALFSQIVSQLNDPLKSKERELLGFLITDILEFQGWNKESLHYIFALIGDIAGLNSKLKKSSDVNNGMIEELLRLYQGGGIKDIKGQIEKIEQLLGANNGMIEELLRLYQGGSIKDIKGQIEKIEELLSANNGMIKELLRLYKGESIQDVKEQIEKIENNVITNKGAILNGLRAILFQYVTPLGGATTEEGKKREKYYDERGQIIYDLALQLISNIKEVKVKQAKYKDANIPIELIVGLQFLSDPKFHKDFLTQRGKIFSEILQHFIPMFGVTLSEGEAIKIINYLSQIASNPKIYDRETGNLNFFQLVNHITREKLFINKGEDIPNLNNIINYILKAIGSFLIKDQDEKQSNTSMVKKDAVDELYKKDIQTILETLPILRNGLEIIKLDIKKLQQQQTNIADKIGQSVWDTLYTKVEGVIISKLKDKYAPNLAPKLLVRNINLLRPLILSFWKGVDPKNQVITLQPKKQLEKLVDALTNLAKVKDKAPLILIILTDDILKKLVQDNIDILRYFLEESKLLTKDQAALFAQSVMTIVNKSAKNGRVEKSLVIDLLTDEEVKIALSNIIDMVSSVIENFLNINKAKISLEVANKYNELLKKEGHIISDNPKITLAPHGSFRKICDEFKDEKLEDVLFSKIQATIRSHNMRGYNFNPDPKGKITLYNISLRDMDLRETKFENMRLNRVKIQGSKISRMHFSGVEIGHETEFLDMKFKDTKFENVQISQAHFTKCELQKAEFNSTKLAEKVLFQNSNLQGANFSEAEFGKQIAFKSCNMRGVKLPSKLLSSITFVDCDLADVDFSMITQDQVIVFERCSFNFAPADLGKLKNCKFKKCSFKDKSADKVTEVSLPINAETPISKSKSLGKPER